MLKKTIKAAFQRLGYQIISKKHFVELTTKLDKLRRVWPQVCFMHIQKTAGTALNQYFYHLFQGANCLIGGMPDQFDNLSNEALYAFDFLSGHFSFHHSYKFRPQRLLITFVRNPVERVFSMYWYCRIWKGKENPFNPGEIPEIVEMCRSHEFSDFIRLNNYQVRSITCNHQAYCFGADWCWPHSPSDGWVAEAALENFEQFAFVGVTERMSESLQTMTRLFSWPSLPEPPRVNTSNRQGKLEITAADREFLAELNQYDLALYERACQRLDKQLAESAAQAGGLFPLTAKPREQAA